MSDRSRAYVRSPSSLHLCDITVTFACLIWILLPLVPLLLWKNQVLESSHRLLRHIAHERQEMDLSNLFVHADSLDGYSRIRVLWKNRQKCRICKSFGLTHQPHVPVLYLRTNLPDTLITP